MSDVEKIILDEIAAKGPMTFARFMELALYHPEHGYYTSGRASIGRYGDFYTSPHTGPVFGQLVCETYVMLKERLGPGACRFVEMGAGEGWLARDFLETMDQYFAADAEDFEYLIVERSDKMRLKQRERLGRLSARVRWSGSVEELPDGICGVFFSNELVDALPFHRVRQEEDALREIFTTYNDGKFREASGVLSTHEIARYLNRLGIRLPRGMSTEVRLDALRWMRAVSKKLSSGYVITVDYGYPACEYYSPERSRGTMMCYQGHKLGEDPYASVGGQDITAHVDFTSICQEGDDAGLAPVIFTDQTSFLMDAACTVERRLRESGAGQEDLEKFGAGLKPLVHPEWMGGAFKVLVQAKNADTEGIFRDVKNDVKRLCECGNNDSFMLS